MCVVYLRVNVLAVSNLLLFALSEPVIITTQFKDVLGELTRYLRRCSLLVLISPIQPEMNLLEHLVHAEAMFKG